MQTATTTRSDMTSGRTREALKRLWRFIVDRPLV
jgi:hypothetical protein